MISRAGPDAGGVLTLGHFANPVKSVLDRPVSLQPADQQTGMGGAVIEGGERVGGLHRGLDHRPTPAQRPAPADDLDRLDRAGKDSVEGAVEADHLERAGLDPAVAAAATGLPGAAAQGSAASAARSRG